MIKLSIITINKNNAFGLEKTIQSVISQTSADFEYIIIDGASTDESVEVIKKYADNICICYWISEPDKGIYNAMNKGIRKAQGEYCLFLNSGDWLISPETLDNVLQEICDNSSDIFYSDLLKSDSTILEFPKQLTLFFFVHQRVNHQNSLIKRSLFLEHGFYNEDLIISSDYEFFLSELWKYKSIFFKLKTNISIFDVGGISSKKSKLRHAEEFIAYQNVFQESVEIVVEHLIFFRKTKIDNNTKNAYKISLKKLYKIAIKRSIKKILEVVLLKSFRKT